MPGYRRLPDHLRTEAEQCSSDSMYLGTHKTLTRADATDGRLEHLGLSVDGDGVRTGGPVIPDASRGRWSRMNLTGRVILRKDLPKVSKHMGGWWAPNFGDASKGEHYVSISRDVWQRQTLHGKQLPLMVDGQMLPDDKVRVGVRVDRVFSREEVGSHDFHMAASLIRENFGEAHVIASDLSVADWLQDQFVGWELLPVGEGHPKVTVDEIIERIGGTSRPEKAAVLQERLDAMSNFGPVAVVVGREHFRRYVGYKFKDDLVVLENFDYGNALYVLYSNWEADSARPRLDLLSDPDARFDRVIHKKGWQGRVEHLLARHGHALP